MGLPAIPALLTPKITGRVRFRKVFSDFERDTGRATSSANPVASGGQVSGRIRGIVRVIRICGMPPSDVKLDTGGSSTFLRRLRGLPMDGANRLVGASFHPLDRVSIREKS